MNDATIIIGEGPTEFYFLTSLKDQYRDIFQNIAPAYPKHTSINELEKNIEQSIATGYNRIYCLIDLDNKKTGTNKANYYKLKNKYHNKHIVNTKKGIDYVVIFVETERCTELFFIYYFQYTTKLFNSSADVEDHLSKICPYQKNQTFFKKHPLHPYFCTYGGTLNMAIKNAEKSRLSASKQNRHHTFSEIGKMFIDLGITI